MNLYRKYRPTKLSEIVGQPAAVATLSAFVKHGNTPQALAFVGPSGVGKTTAARIMADRLKCGRADFREINAAEVRGIDGVREIQDKMTLAPMNGPVRVYLIDECQQLTKDAQSAILKMLEDPPGHVYFMLATTDPQKLLPTIRTRCSEVLFGSVGDKDMLALLRDVLSKERVYKKVGPDVIDKIVEASGGSPRKALVHLEQVLGIEGEKAQLEAINMGDTQAQAKALCQALIYGKKWEAVSAILRNLPDEPEQVRRAVLGYAQAVLLGNNAKCHARAYLVIEEFSQDLFTTGKPGLTRAAYAVVSD